MFAVKDFSKKLKPPQSFQNIQGAQRTTYRAPEYNVPPLLTVNKSGQLGFFDWQEKQQELSEDNEVCRKATKFTGK